MHAIRNILSIQQRNKEILDKLKKGQTSKKQIMKKYKISKSTLRRIKRRNADKIKKLAKEEINLIRKRVNEAKYNQLQDSSYKCYQKRIKPGDFSKPFKAKEIEHEFDGPSTIDEEKQLLGNLKPFKREKHQESNYKSRNLSENSQSLVQETKTEQELDAEKFIQKFNHQLEEKNIGRDNIYTMIKISFKFIRPYVQYIHQAKNKIHVEKLKKDRLFIMFCTNATGSHKLSPFYIYEHEDKETTQFLKNTKSIVFTSKENTSKNDKIFANWYNNNFMKLVKKHQKKTNASGKVLLLVEKCKTFILPEDAMQNDNFEILFFPFGTSQIFQPLKLLNMRQKIRQKFDHFDTYYSIEFFIKEIRKLWANISSAHIEYVWKKLLKSDSLIKENAIFLVEQMSKLDKNVIKEDTVSRNSSASRDDKLDSLFSKVEQDCLSVFRKTENTTSTCMVKQKSKLTKSALKEHNNIALKETPTEVNENIQFLFSKLICASELLCSSKTENATSTWMVKQTSELIKNVTGEDTAFKETPTEIEMEIKEPQQNTEIKLDKFTKRILQHLKLRNVLRTAVHDVMIDNRSISDVAGSYKLNIEILQLKIDILKNRRKYLQRKIKYEAAIKDIIAEKRSKLEAVRHYGICQKTLDREIARRKHRGKKYKFDRKVMSVSEVDFTFQQEQLLLKSLEIWINLQDKRMCNSICVLKYLSILAYEFVKENNIRYPEDWDVHKRADIFWLREFEMRYSNDILILLYHCIYKRDSKKKISDKQQLLHLFDKNMSNIIFETI